MDLLIGLEEEIRKSLSELPKPKTGSCVEINQVDFLENGGYIPYQFPKKENTYPTTRALDFSGIDV